MSELNNVKTTTRIITNPRHPIRPFRVDPKRTDEYAYRPATPKPLFVRASETLGKLQIDPRRIEKTPQHIRPPWITHPTNNTTLDCAKSDVVPATNVSARKRPADFFKRLKPSKILRRRHDFCGLLWVHNRRKTTTYGVAMAAVPRAKQKCSLYSDNGPNFHGRDVE
jgi:hypothetical protein